MLVFASGLQDDRDERGWRPPAPTENPALEKYYKVNADYESAVPQSFVKLSVANYITHGSACFTLTIMPASVV